MCILKSLELTIEYTRQRDTLINVDKSKWKFKNAHMTHLKTDKGKQEKNKK